MQTPVPYVAFLTIPILFRLPCSLFQWLTDCRFAFPPPFTMPGVPVAAAPAAAATAAGGGASKATVDTVVHARWVLPVAPTPDVVLENHAVVIDKDLIVAILPSAEATDRYEATTVVHRPGHAVMPGLINAHTHTGLTLLRGCADDTTLFTWLHETIWPVEGAFASAPGFCADGARLAMAEMLAGGVTTFADMYWFPAEVAAAVEAVGMRAVLGMVVIGFPSAYASTPAEYLDKGEAAAVAFGHVDTLHWAYAPHAPYTVADETWADVARRAEATGRPIHTHVHETRAEVDASVAGDRTSPSCHQSDTASRPLANLARLGIVNRRLAAAHMVHASDEDLAAMAAAGASIIHCPSSNLKLAAGLAPVAKMIAAGVNVALGTDSAASNNGLNVLGEARLGSLLAKGVSGDATAVPAAAALAMATINGARAFGLDALTGSLVVGKKADVTCIQLANVVGCEPVFHPLSAVVYAACRKDVSDVWVNGRRLVKEGVVVAMDVPAVVAKAVGWQRRIEECLAGVRKKQAADASEKAA